MTALPTGSFERLLIWLASVRSGKLSLQETAPKQPNLKAPRQRGRNPRDNIQQARDLDCAWIVAIEIVQNLPREFLGCTSARSNRSVTPGEALSHNLNNESAQKKRGIRVPHRSPPSLPEERKQPLQLGLVWLAAIFADLEGLSVADGVRLVRPVKLRQL
jgi:hypothetical protein